MDKRAKKSLTEPKTGLHNMGEALNQKTYVLAHLNDLLENGNRIFEHAYTYTEANVPIRIENFFPHDHEGGHPKKRSREATLERKIFKDYGPTSGRDDKNFLKDGHVHILDYQVPLYPKGKGKEGWRAIDLMGVDENDCPVIIELKTDTSKETPLRMLIEVVAYGIAIRKHWNRSAELSSSEFKTEFFKKAKINNPPERGVLSLMLLAPEKYWHAWKNWAIRRKPHPEIWGEFKKLVGIIENKGFRVIFAQLKDDKNDSEKINPWEGD